MTLLLPTKLNNPGLHAGFIIRPRLQARLNRGVERKCTLVSAPAGFGKTTLLAQWTAGHDTTATPSRLTRIAWLSLDDQDNALPRFLTYLTAALTGQNPVERRHKNDRPRPAETVLDALIAGLSRTSEPLALLLDDYHLITNPAMHTAVVYLLEHAPPQLRLVIAGRSDPPLALARWRVRDELSEIRAAELQFTVEETGRFLQHALDHPPPHPIVERLHKRTEGWPAGLQLAVLSLRGLDREDAQQFVDAFDGTHRHVFAYLVEEVFQRQPPTVRQFLLQTAILDRFCASLCDEVTAIRSWNSKDAPDGPLRNSHQVLEYLLGHNLFVVPLDPSGQWYRYHRLFAEALHARLEDDRPEWIPELHRRAAHWYAAHNGVEEAVRHALAADDSELAAGLLASGAEQPWIGEHQGLPLDPLTPRELEILRLVALGATNQAIADRLVISLGTVKGHLNHVFSKLDAGNRTEAVARARALRLL